MAVLVANPEADPAATAGDGIVALLGVGGDTWAGMHDAVFATTFLSNDATDDLILAGSPGGSNWTDMSRLIFNFDTSSLGATATVTAATLSLFCMNIVFTFPTDRFIAVCGVTPGMDTLVMPTDYPLFGAVRYCDTDIAFPAITTGAYNDWVFNAAGIAAIDVSGVTNIGLRTGADLDDTEPPDGGLASATFIMADLGANPPVLTVTYTLPGSTGKRKLFILTVYGRRRGEPFTNNVRRGVK